MVTNIIYLSYKIVIILKTFFALLDFFYTNRELIIFNNLKLNIIFNEILFIFYIPNQNCILYLFG